MAERIFAKYQLPRELQSPPAPPPQRQAVDNSVKTAVCCLLQNVLTHLLLVIHQLISALIPPIALASSNALHQVLHHILNDVKQGGVQEVYVQNGYHMIKLLIESVLLVVLLMESIVMKVQVDIV